MTTFAFPSGHNPQRGRQEDGMTLRDYFAAKAMQALIPIAAQKELTSEWVSDDSYKIADAMLKVRDES